MGQRAPTAPTTSVSACWIYALVSTTSYLVVILFSLLCSLVVKMTLVIFHGSVFEDPKVKIRITVVIQLPATTVKIK